MNTTTPHNQPVEPIQIWEFNEAPIELRQLSTNGGDEDWVALLPPPFPEDDDIVKVTIVKANDLGVKYRFVSGKRKYSMPKSLFLSIYRKANP